MIEVINTTSTTLTANQTIPFTTTTYRTRDNIIFNQTTNEFRLLKPGMYDFQGDFNVKATTAGEVTIQMYIDGTAVPGAVATATAADVGDSVNLSIDKYILANPALYGNSVVVKFVTTTGCEIVSVTVGIE